MNLSLRWKITVSMWMLAAMCAFAFGLASSWLLVRNHDKSIEQQLKNTAGILISLGITDYSGLEGFQKLEFFVEDTLKTRKIDKIINVFTKRGKLMFHSPPTPEDDLQGIFKPVESPTFSIYNGANNKYKILTTPYQAKNEKDYYLQIAMAYPSVSEIIVPTLWEALLLFIILSAASFIAAHILAQRIVRPIRSIARHLAHLDPASIKDWTPLIIHNAVDPLHDIIAGINSLIIKVKSALYSMSRTSRYLAHELRNPLTILICAADDVLSNKGSSLEDYRTTLKSSLEEVEKINNVVSTVLKVAEREKLSYHPVPCNLNRLFDEDIAKWKTTFWLDIEWTRPETDIIGVADPDMLTQLIDNLMRNIKEHSGSTRSKISLIEDEDGVVITVEDFGVGLDKKLMSALARSDENFEKLGIGLMLCLEISSICRFKTTFQNKPSGGLLVEIRL